MTELEKNSTDFNGFFEELASVSPAPGGGSVAALAGASGTALLAMVAKITLKKADLEDDLKQKLQELIPTAESACDRFKCLIKEDADAYNGVINAFKLPKGTEDEKNQRVEEIQKALKHAADIPMEVFEYATRMLANARVIAEFGSANCLSDSAVAVSMLSSAVHCARLNVEINLKLIKDDDYKQMQETKLNKLQEEADNLSSTANEIIKQRF